jgi:flavin reductase (DIM6/NTAB) family NADH-FMN oxidoreductase RutF
MADRLPSPAANAPEGTIRDPRGEALSLIPHGSFLLTAAYGEIRGGIVARWIQQVSTAPPLVVVAIEKGQPLSPIIRDARRFVLCQLAPEDRVLRRLFEGERTDPMDPFLGLSCLKAPGGAPIPTRAMAWLDCELTRHLDVEGNCELYIGLVHAGAVIERVAPAVAHPIPGRDEPKPAPRPAKRNGHATVRVPSKRRTTR